MFICNHCGCALEDNSKPCPECGAVPAALSGGEPETRTRGRRPQDAKSSQPSSAKRRAPSQPHPNLKWLDRELLMTMLVIKLFVILFGVQAYNVFQNASTRTFYGWLEIWNRWDAPHYLDIARDGYTATGEQRFWIVFHPLYPWLVRACAFVSGDYLVAAFVVSAVASVAAGLLLRRLAALDDDEETARGAVWFMYIFPTSYFMHIGYTESLFLALAVGAFLAARGGRWWAAGVLTALAGLTRVNGTLLVPALAVEAYAQYRRERRWRAEWLWIALGATGLVGYLLLNLYVTGDALTFMTIQREHWFKEPGLPWVGLGNVWDAAWTRAPSQALMIGWQELLFAALGLACTVWCARSLRASYAVWMGLNWLLWTSTSFVLSVPRYTLILFPIFILFARLARARFFWRASLTVWSLVSLALFASLFVQGLWAF